MKLIKYPSLSKEEIAAMYNISVWVLNRWVKPFEDELGNYLGKCYCPKQVEIIFNYKGIPVGYNNGKL